MKKYSPHFGAAGLALIVLGALGWAIAPMFIGFYVIPWTLAAFCLLIFLAYNYDRLGSVLSSRSVKYGLGSALSVILVFGIVVFIALMTNKNSVRFDMTSSQRYSLAPQTIKVLDALETEVKVTAFFQTEGGGYVAAKDLLDQYAHESDKFKYEMVDPDRNPARAQAAGVTRYGTSVVEAAGESEQINAMSEERLTNAVLRVTKPGRKKIYFLTGHGEKDLADVGKTGYSEVKTVLEGQNYEVEPLLLMKRLDVPEDAAVLVIPGPQKDFVQQEYDALERYLRSGGKALIMIDPQTVPKVVEFMKKLNVELGDDIIVDKMSKLFGADYLMPLVAQYTQHPVTKDFKLASLFPLARSVSVTEDKAEGVAAVSLAATGDQAWAETDLKRLADGTAEFVEGEDVKGPVGVAVVGTVDLENEEEADQPPRPEDMEKKEKQGKFIVFGDSDFACNTYFNFQGNGDLFLSGLGWLAEEADLVAIRAKDATSTPLMLSSIQARLVFWLPVVVMPLAVVFIGVMVLMVRRRRQ